MRNQRCGSVKLEIIHNTKRNVIIHLASFVAAVTVSCVLLYTPPGSFAIAEEASSISVALQRTSASASSESKTVTEQAAPGLLFVNSDFEKGDLTNWTATGRAFEFQPTKGDNPTVRGRNQPSRHNGDFWIGTYEKYQGIGKQKPGRINGDRQKGTLTSVPFQIRGDSITFLVGGGKLPKTEYVALLVDGQEVLKVSGNGSESMERQDWDVTAYKGKSARIFISDQFSGGWGHINADDFRYEGYVEPAGRETQATVKVWVPGLLFENSDFEKADLSNWTAVGIAFKHQPVLGDNPKARNRKQSSNHQGDFWIGTYEMYQGIGNQKPGKIIGDRQKGTLTSIPFKIEGDRITFLIGGGNRLEKEYVALVVDGEEVLKATGNDVETMQRQDWDVSAYKGKSARIFISDQFSGGWGHINADDFRYEKP
jgi:hypothetical protein